MEERPKNRTMNLPSVEARPPMPTGPIEPVEQIQPIELEGQIEGVTYFNEESGFIIARLAVKGGSGQVTVTGSIHPVTPGESLRLRGIWHDHPKYGRQFKFDSCELLMPATCEGIEKYLGSGLIKGIGPVTAKRIVNKFGAETLDVIDNSISRLGEVGGVGDVRIKMIESAWAEQQGIKEVMLFLHGHGVSSSCASKIFRQYGRDSVRVVRDNPYRLASEITGIGFLTADRIAEKMGIAKDSPLRAEAGVLYVLNELSSGGHVYYPHGALLDECAKVLSLGRDTVALAVSEAASRQKLVIEEDRKLVTEENTEERPVYLHRFYVSEAGIAEGLGGLLGSPKTLPSFDMEKALEWAQREQGITLSSEQKEAVRQAVKGKAVVITGGPGTGKTTVINSVIRIFGRLGLKVLLAAPTGRAAKRLAEASGQEAKTIHRLLEYSPREGGFRRTASNPLEADLIVIDETSMVDTMLMAHLLSAVPQKAALVLVGDSDQLPSIGPGDVLNDIMASGRMAVVRLREIFRQSGESLIVTNAHRINKGEMPEFSGSDGRDFYFIELEEPEKILSEIISLCREKLPRRFNFNPFKDIQVITAMHKGVIGTVSLNAELQRALNPSTESLSRGGRVFKKGDKVMQMVNNYDKDVYNGDIGTISRIMREEHRIAVDFEGSEVLYDYKDMDEIALAYAVSVHKSQGSEYPAVVMPVHTQHYLLLQRNLLYTGLTRGKRLVVMIGTKKAVGIAVRNDKPRKRYTLLKRRLTAG